MTECEQAFNAGINAAKQALISIAAADPTTHAIGGRAIEVIIEGVDALKFSDPRTNRAQRGHSSERGRTMKPKKQARQRTSSCHGSATIACLIRTPGRRRRGNEHGFDGVRLKDEGDDDV